MGKPKTFATRSRPGSLGPVNEIAILGLSLVGFFATATLIIFTIQERAADKRPLEFRMFQMENTHIVQQLAKSTNEIARSTAQRHEDSMKYLEGITGSLARIIRKQEDGESPKQ